MGYREVRCWTLSGLIMAFIELAIAYTLLCGSAFAFLPSKLLSFFGVYVPCPCSGFFGYQNYDLCFHRLLVDWPRRTIITLQELAKNRFPFDLIWFEHQSCNLHVGKVGIRSYGNGIFELDGDACSSSISGPEFQSSIDKESGCDSKGKKIVNLKQKSGFRRRRRAALGYGKLTPALSSTSNTAHSVGISVPHSLYESSVIEDGFQGDQNAPNSPYFSERIRCSVELDGSYVRSEDTNRDSSSVEKLTFNTEDRLCSDANVIQVLEQSLAEEKAAHAAIYQELEKERTAAATAADEAMAMILRLQEDKASIEMEARQYHRLIEEKFNYDEEEMKILKEILVRREKEIHFLEKEVEAYQQMDFVENDHVEDDSFSVDSPPAPQQIENRESISEKEVRSSITWLSSHDHSHSLAFGKEMMSKELASDLSTSQILVQKNVSSAGKEERERDICMISPTMKSFQNCCAIGEELEKDEKQWDPLGCNIDGSVVDTESTVYDVHVVDDTTRVQNSKISSDSPTMHMAEIESIVHGSNSDVQRKPLVSGNSLHKTFNIDSQRRSPSQVDRERFKVDNEVEWLREWLRIVQEEKEKLTFSADQRERVNARLKLVEDVVNQLREIQQLREPVRHASLPPSSSKASMKKRHHRSASYEDFERESIMQ